MEHKKIIVIYLATLIPMVIIDGVWLLLMNKNFYAKQLSHLFAHQPSWIPAILFYLLFTAGLTFFVIIPAIELQSSLIKIFFTGAFFGLITYATYDLTNQATLREWPTIVTLVDLSWGALAIGTVSCLAAVFIRFVK